MSKLIKSVALWLHQIHNNTYSSYKIRKYRLKPISPLTPKERNFYLKLRPALQGDSLIVYDIGAAEGNIAKCLAKLPNVLEVHAFEAIPTVCSNLEQQVENIPKIHCHNIALGNFRGSSSMYISKNSDSSSLLPMSNLHTEEFHDTNITNKIKVSVMCLDDFVKERGLSPPHLIKIDTQGFEKKIVEGGLETVRQAKYCMLEISFKPLYQGSPVFDDVYRLMYDLGFRLVGTSKPMLGESGIPLQVDGMFENQSK